MRVLGELLRRARLWMEENPEDETRERQAWDAVHAVLDDAGVDELGEAVSELVEAAEMGDRDAESVVNAFGRFHPPGALGNPDRQRQVIGLYLVFSEGALWDTSADVDNPDFRRAVRQLFE